MSYHRKICAGLCLGLCLSELRRTGHPHAGRARFGQRLEQGARNGITDSPIRFHKGTKGARAGRPVDDLCHQMDLYEARPSHEIIDEYGHWRQVRDDTGVTGWMHTALLSGTRTAVVAPWLTRNALLRANPEPAGATVAELQPRVMLSLHSCTGTWCRVSVKEHSAKGYVRQDRLWGAYPGEMFQ